MNRVEKNAEMMARLTSQSNSRGFFKKNGKRRQRNSDYLLEMGSYVDRGAYLPSPEEIARGTAKIRAGWSERERLSRCQLPGAIPVEFVPIRMTRVVKHLSGDHS